MSVFELAMKHVSTRVFLQRDIDEGDLTRILEVARRAPSAWNMQSYHVIAVRDQSLTSSPP
ncbi:nitroreductase family protein [Desulfurococcus mucosus]|uniref:nitroreductase family protein n=1 Tax=Desulfurococcus mucosus TaxID=2275 RepID=UPI00064F0706|nr:nitroreductase family protein [Desulfurococcus mucosus]